jgi:pyruvate dehydrogenase (quinone)
MSKRVAEILVETLQAAGVKRCYGIVGDTLNRIAQAINRSEIDWVHMRHEEAGAFAAGAEAQFTGGLTACAGSCGPGSLHFINGLYEANRNRAPVILIATQIVRQDIGFQSIQEVDCNEVYKGCGVYCEMIVTPEQARRMAVAACQAALTKRGVAVLVVPADIANAPAHDEAPYAVHARRPLVRPTDADLDEIAAILNESEAITIYAGAGCAGAHDEVVATAARLKAPMAHTSRGKDFVEYDNPYNVGMTGMIGGPAGYHAILNCDALLLLGPISPGASSIRTRPRSSRLMRIRPILAEGTRSRSARSAISRRPWTHCFPASSSMMTTASSRIIWSATGRTGPQQTPKPFRAPMPRSPGPPGQRFFACAQRRRAA